jgi:hypothetical protein
MWTKQKTPPQFQKKKKKLYKGIQYFKNSVLYRADTLTLDTTLRIADYFHKITRVFSVCFVLNECFKSSTLNCEFLLKCAIKKKMNLVDIGSTILISLPSTIQSHTCTVSGSLSFFCESVHSCALFWLDAGRSRSLSIHVSCTDDHSSPLLVISSQVRHSDHSLICSIT